MKWGILLISMGYREQGMLTALDSIARVHPGAGVTAVLQGYRVDSPVYNHPQIVNIISYPDGLGPHTARIVALPGMLESGLDVVVNMDDDMELLPRTDLRPSILRSMVKGVGLVNNMWRRFRKSAAKVECVHQFVDSPLVETGGGLAYSAATAKVILDGPDLDYLYDDSEWSLRTYLAGLVNQRYLGSIALHQSRSAGGRLAWSNGKQRALSDERYLTPIKFDSLTGIKGVATTKIGKRAIESGNGVKFPIVSNLTRLAHSVHGEQRANLQ